MSNILAKYGISAERERAMWREQNRKDLLYCASWSLGKKIEAVEGMEQVARSIRREKFSSTTDEHEERTTL